MKHIFYVQYSLFVILTFWGHTKVSECGRIIMLCTMNYYATFLFELFAVLNST